MSKSIKLVVCLIDGKVNTHLSSWVDQTLQLDFDIAIINTDPQQTSREAAFDHFVKNSGNFNRMKFYWRTDHKIAISELEDGLVELDGHFVVLRPFESLNWNEDHNASELLTENCYSIEVVKDSVSYFYPRVFNSNYGWPKVDVFEIEPCTVINSLHGLHLELTYPEDEEYVSEYQFRKLANMEFWGFEYDLQAFNWLELAQAYLAVNLPIKALEKIENYLEKHPTHDFTWFVNLIKAGIIQDLGYGADAVIYTLQQSFNDNPMAVEPLLRIAEALLDTGKVDTAYAIYEQAKDINLENTELIFRRSAYRYDVQVLYIKICLSAGYHKKAEAGLLQINQRKDLPEDIETWVDQSLKAVQKVIGSKNKYNGVKNADADDIKITIGMAAFDDFDGVYFSILALRMYHPEITNISEILIVDNNPGSEISDSLKQLTTYFINVRYVSYNEYQGTSVRNMIFHHAIGEYVMVMDSHVFVESGAIQKLINYVLENPQSKDLLQGPLLRDDMKTISTQFECQWSSGMLGVWGCDERGTDPDAEAFDIPAQGLGLFACRKDAWLGFNSRFRGFGGEEHYIHQKFRDAGRRTLCLPFLRWGHRFIRPKGIPYPINWQDRITNYVIGFNELNQQDMVSGMLEHFKDVVNSDEEAEKMLAKAEEEANNPFLFFDAIYCINLRDETDRWEQVQKRFKDLGIGSYVRKMEGVSTRYNTHVGCALSHRKVIERAKLQNFQHVLVFEDDVVFSEDMFDHLASALQELGTVNWNLFYLGGCKRNQPNSKVDDCTNIVRPQFLTTTHAVAYHQNIYDTLLNELPENMVDMENWIDENIAIDQFYPSLEDIYLIDPTVALQTNLLDFEEPERIHLFT